MRSRRCHARFQRGGPRKLGRFSLPAEIRGPAALSLRPLHTAARKEKRIIANGLRMPPQPNHSANSYSKFPTSPFLPKQFYPPLTGRVRAGVLKAANAE